MGQTDAHAESGRTDERPPLPPGPDGYPVVGNTLQFVRDPFAFYDRMEAHGDVVRYTIAGDEYTTLLHPDLVEQVLVEDDATYQKAEFMRESGIDFLENGVLLSEGEAWRRQRTMLQPMFFRERVETYGDTMAAYAARRVDSWTDGETVSMTEEMSSLALSILARTLFGVDIRDEQSAIRDAAAAVQERGDAGTLTAFLPDWVPTKANRRFRRATDDFDAVVRRLVAERERERERAHARDGDGDGDAARDDLLSLLLTATDGDGEGMSEETIRDQLMTFLFAGHETTSLALTYTWYLLARNPEVAATLRAELDDVLGGDRPTAADTARLEYTEQVIKESMRRYPPAYVLFRQPLEDVQLGGYRIPEGTYLTLPSFKIHNDPRWWDDPEAFRPERFDGQNNRPEYAYFPFGGGPRHCIGMRFAMLEMQLVLATMAQRVSFDCSPGLELDPTAAVTLQPGDPMEMTVRKR